MSRLPEQPLQPPEPHYAGCRCIECVDEWLEATADDRYERAYWQEQERAS